ncbi:MAG TPA: response regulator [Candidatus Binatia bacterium]|nr:response regulator [Candidatus Binatia bacterium]
MQNGNNRPRLTGSILVVEDDADIRSMTLTILEGAGATVAGAASAAEAIECLEHTSFDAVVLDWNLAGDTGGALLQRLRDRHPGLLRRSAVVTGDLLSIPGQHEAEHFGCPVIAKPFRPSQLIETIAAILHG